MKKAIGLIKLLRIKHYIKNGLVFLPLFFSMNLFNGSLFLKCTLGFLVFCAISSVVYIINDIRDVEKDRLHSKKCNRPIASGLISIRIAILTAVILMAAACGILFVLKTPMGAALALLYVIVNLSYSLGLKNIPIVDLVLLVSGFVLRLLFGGVITGIPISTWLFITVICAAFYMGLGKRRGEILTEGEDTREVNKRYSIEFLDQQMTVFVTLILVFYSLWCIMIIPESGFKNPGFEWSLILVMLIFIRYNYNLKRNSDGDPTGVLLGDPMLITLAVIYCVYITVIVYFPIELLHRIAELI